MIDPNYLNKFKSESSNYEHLQARVKAYVEDRYEVSRKRAVSVYSVRVGFQMTIGNIPQSVLAYWLQEWGYRVDPSNGVNTDGLHNVFIRLKPLVADTKETHYQKEWKPKRRGSFVY